MEETHQKPQDTVKYNNYTSVRQDITPREEGRVHEAIVFIVRNNISYKEITLNSKLQAAVGDMRYPFESNICIIYLSN